MSEIDPIRESTGSALPVPPPPHPLDREWHLYIDGKPYGPYSGYALRDFVREGRVNSKTNVCPVGEAGWIEAAADQVLATLFPGKSGAPAISLGTGVPAVLPPNPVDTSVRNEGGGSVVQITQHFGSAPMPGPEFYGEFGPKSPGLALFLSFLIPGVGQFYLGHVGKGIAMILLCIALWFVLLGWIIWIWAMIDAYSSAKTINVMHHARMARQWSTR